LHSALFVQQPGIGFSTHMWSARSQVSVEHMLANVQSALLVQHPVIGECVHVFVVRSHWSSLHAEPVWHCALVVQQPGSGNVRQVWFCGSQTANVHAEPEPVQSPGDVQQLGIAVLLHVPVSVLQVSFVQASLSLQSASDVQQLGIGVWTQVLSAVLQLLVVHFSPMHIALSMQQLLTGRCTQVCVSGKHSSVVHGMLSGHCELLVQQSGIGKY